MDSVWHPVLARPLTVQRFHATLRGDDCRSRRRRKPAKIYEKRPVLFMRRRHQRIVRLLERVSVFLCANENSATVKTRRVSFNLEEKNRMVRFEDDGESGVDALVGLRGNCERFVLGVSKLRGVRGASFRGVGVFSVVGLPTGRVGDGGRAGVGDSESLLREVDGEE